MLTDLKLRLRSLFKRDDVERELDDELMFHLQQLTASFERQGMAPDEAARRARVALGGFDQIKEAHRDARGVHLVADLGRDLRYAVRQIRRAPAFAALATLCLGLGIGVNVAIFSVINAVVLRPLPVIDADRLIRINRGDQAVLTYGNYQQLRDETRVLSGATVSFPMESDIDLNGESEFVVAEAVPANYGSVMGVALTLGRWPADEAEPTAVISHSVWERRFNRDPSVLGRLIRSEAQTYTIVGVAPRAFGGVFRPMRTDIWVPVRTRPRLAAMIDERKTTRMMWLFGRLRDGVTSTEATTELNIIDARLAARARGT